MIERCGGAVGQAESLVAAHEEQLSIAWKVVLHGRTPPMRGRTTLGLQRSSRFGQHMCGT